MEQHNLKKTIFDRHITTFKERICLEKDSHPKKIYVKPTTSTSQLVFAIAILFFILLVSILQIHASNNREHTVLNGKDAFALMELDYFDQCIAFGSSNPNQLFSLDDIIALGFLSNQNAQYLQKFEENHHKTHRTTFEAYQYGLYLGIKDDQDVIMIVLLQDPKVRFLFESNLEYRFQAIIEEMERITSTRFTSEFLNNAFQEDGFTYSGISIFIEQNTQTGQHQIIYRTIIHDVEYGLRKG